MDLDKPPAALAADAAEAVRALNHRTLDPASFENPADAGDVALHLKSLIDRLPQALNQLGAGLYRFDADQRIRMDDGTDPCDTVADCLAALNVARANLTAVASALGVVSARTSHMGGFFNDDDEDDAGERIEAEAEHG
ncbi:hypothetical protein [Streptomyces sp. NPDC056132]|uniref:hypothetical protein n=1 Tax=Streptomyces sp. NPDC056132 TaxID=3345722 RepID=UPI0035E3B08C